jgi:hypothetical protein
LWPYREFAGEREFYCLTTGLILKGWSFTPLLMPDSVIKQVNKINLREKQGQEF